MKLPARCMSWLIRARSGAVVPMVGRFSTTAVMAIPEISSGNVQPMVLTSGLIATLTGYFRIKRVFAEALRSRGRHVRLLEFIEEVAPDDADEFGRVAGPHDQDRNPQVFAADPRIWPNSRAHSRIRGKTTLLCSCRRYA